MIRAGVIAAAAMALPSARLAGAAAAAPAPGGSAYTPFVTAALRAFHVPRSNLAIYPPGR
jgi:hypothetical protein